MLDDAGVEPFGDAVDRRAGLVLTPIADSFETRHETAQSGHRKAPFPPFRRLLRERFDDRIRKNRPRNGGRLRVTLAALEAEDDQLEIDPDLGRREADTSRSLHRVEQVDEQRFEGASELGHRLRDAKKSGITHAQDFTDAHAPESAATRGTAARASPKGLFSRSARSPWPAGRAHWLRARLLGRDARGLVTDSFNAYFRWGRRGTAAIAAAVVVLVLGCARLLSASHGIRYVQHPDEHYLYGHARTVLTEPGLNPHFFRYPSLPIYLTAGAIQVRHWFGVEPDSDRSSREVAPDSVPRFSSPKLQGERYEGAPLIAAARLFFAGLGAALFAWVAIVARAAGARTLYALAPVVLAFSGLIQLLVAGYQNVDTPTLFFSGAALASMLVWFDEDSWLKKAIVPGLLCGLATASKYNSGLVLGSGVLAIALAPSVSRKVHKIGALAGAFVAAFLLAVPYAILDFPTFRTDVLLEMRHYRMGHPGYEGPAGLPQLGYYLSELANDYGFVASGLALVGIPLTFRRDWRRGLALFAFPATMLAHMSTNRVHFLRTIAPVFALVPVYATVALDGLCEELGRRARALLGERASPATLVVTLGTFFALVAATPAQAKRLFDRNRKPETRDQAVAWVLRSTAAGETVYLPRDLGVRPRDLPARRIVLLPPALAGATGLVTGRGVLLLPRFGAPTSTPSRLRRDAVATDAFREEGRRRAEIANANRARLIEAVGARCEKRFRGAATAFPQSLEKGAEPRSNPEIVGCFLGENPREK